MLSRLTSGGGGGVKDPGDAASGARPPPTRAGVSGPRPGIARRPQARGLRRTDPRATENRPRPGRKRSVKPMEGEKKRRGRRRASVAEG